ncbi:hypothetical protein [Burkholderia ubonensis]|uniref:hypothetical protein n=1 Tax=Burkholderia ubonensis TaxID=101571 RepID=UPI00075B002F|nr:hypothetical protein [Burkholderia ubonensis]AOI68730.1 hypothetical protein WI31_03615 [Burkholderia ubonensis]KUZ17411.1 hypothetical protein WI29_17945 [Burkholderia ubonensis]KUZ31187.1 hypothetical protein WI32_00970 [Burkholderia ubonensis]KUZ37959.1 hypothetical protein WI30_04730 [Burkholderia ubonensis]KUZ39959.1 hypothetical protein WI33_34445 [Burkholderia ubonensis]
MTWFDRAERVLPLVSHVAQVVTVALTAGGLYFTVVPLYQKAAVDEQVAKQQLKLEQLEQRVDASYQKIRKDAVRQYVFSAGMQCTGLMLPLPSLGSNKPNPDLIQQTLDINIPECMRNELANVSDIAELRQDDKAALSAAIDKASKEIDSARLAAQVRVSQVDAARDREGPLDIDAFSLQLLAILKKAGTSDQELRQLMRMLNTNSIKLKVKGAYVDLARNEIAKLLNVTWPQASTGKE